MKKIFTLSAALSCALFASETTLEKITVSSEKEGVLAIKTDDFVRLKNPSDTASLLDMKAGVSLNTGGGFSSLPSIHGLADDRINTTVDGMQITSACPNHMNPALSYIDPSKVKSIAMTAGIAPVSEGGDSIAGSISVKSKEPIFAANAGEVFKDIAVSLFYRSNNHNQGTSTSANVATDKISFNYSGFAEKAEDYHSGDGRKVTDTVYKQQNQSATLAYKTEAGVVKFTLGSQMIPYQGFPNQYMDMNKNDSIFGNLSFDGKIGDTKLEANAFKKLTSHYMNHILSERVGNMPMYTAADELGYNVKATIPLTSEHVIKIGSDFDKYKLNDWWPAVMAMVGGMGPNTFWNINNGHRDRLGLFAESNYQWSEKLSSNIGVRTDIVSMNTDDVVGYNSTINDGMDAAAFNAKNHKKTDNNYDITASMMYENNKNSALELGYARKTRSPNLYERYSWAGGYGNALGHPSIAMDMAMVNWVGDGNGYVGNVDLKPETANTFSATVSLHDDSSRGWGVKITPYYTMVQDYIDADFIATASGATTGSGYGGIRLLKFANHNAVLFGSDISANANVWDSQSLGKAVAKAVVSYTRGYRTDGSGSLYHIMPLNIKASLEQTIGSWTNGLYAQAVASKEQVNTLRNEPITPGYALVDVKTNYKFSKNVNFDFAVTNLFDKSYFLPLGGIDAIEKKANRTANTSLRGEGRSFNTAVNVKF